jgi:hypothetical protein
MPAQGHLGYLAVAKESTWGTKVVSGMDFVEILSENVVPTFAEMVAAGINTSRVETKRVQGPKTVAGPIDFEVNPEDVIGDLLLSLLPSETTVDDGVGNGGQHTFKVGNTPPAGLTLQVGRDVAVRDIFGARVSKMAFKTDPKNFLTCTAEVTGKDDEAATPQTPTYTTQNPLVGHTGTIQIDAGAAVVTDFSIEIDGGLKTDRRGLGSKLIQQQQPGVYKVTGEFKMFFDDLTLVNKFINATAAALDFDFTGAVVGTTTRRLQFVLPNIFLNGTMPNLTGREEEIMVPFTFRAIAVAGADLLSVKLNNSKRTAY